MIGSKVIIKIFFFFFNDAMLFIFLSYNTQQLTKAMRPNTATENTTQKIQQIIANKFNEKEQKLDLSTLMLTQMVVRMIGRACWSSETGLHSALST